MKSYILTDKEKIVLVRYAKIIRMSAEDRALLATLKHRIMLYYEKLRSDMDLVEEAMKKWERAPS